jgi:AcrR family transcriptional regulator
MATRRYTLGRRAEKQAQTRKRIVDAAMALHEELGPRNTTISAVAERAGVQRLTVYRHFVDDQALFAACTSTWLEANPPPGLAHGESAFDAARKTLEAHYRYYRRTADMWAAAYRDVDTVPALRGPMQEFEAYLDGTGRALVLELQPPKAQKARIAATLRHALEFSTWRSLSRQRLRDAAMASLVLEWARGVS